MSSDRGRVTRLVRYPVKACGGEQLDSCEVAVDGLRNDRVLAVVVGDRVVTQRELPVLAAVRPALDDTTARLDLSFPGTDPVHGVVRTDGPRREVTLFGEPVVVVDQDGQLSAWFTELLGQPARLVGAPATTRRTSPGAVEGQTVLADEGSVSVHSVASLGRLNAALRERGHPELPADRFRANLVVDGCAAHAEDVAGLFEVGDVVLGFAQLDERCAVTTVDQVTGRRSGPEPLRTLADYRRGGTGAVRFGVYVAVLVPGLVRAGDPVVLTPRS